jgi:hypothetical protein
MTGVLFLIILSLCVIYVDFHRTKENMAKAKTNGLGVLPYVLNGNATAPAQYRVLVPWLTALFSGRIGHDVSFSQVIYLNAYVLIRAIAITVSLTLCAILWQNPLWVCVLAMFYVVSAIYDYTDVYFEVAFFALAMILFGHNLPILLFLVALVAGLNRETAVFIPFLGIPDGGIANIISASAGAIIGAAIPYAVYGKAPRYCAVSQYRVNWEDLKMMITAIPFAYNETFQYLILVALMVVGAIMSPSYSMLLAWGMLVVLSIPARIREIRVFAPCVFLLIPVVLK